MPTQVDIAVEVEPALETLADVQSSELRAAIRRSLAEALQHGVGETRIVGRERGLVRTGALLESVRGELDPGLDKLSGRIGVAADSPAAKYAYLLTDAVMTIEPVNALALTIPTKNNQTPAGVPIYPSVAALKAEHGAKNVRRIGSAIGVMDAGEFIAMFFLVKSVQVDGRDVLEPAGERALPEMTEMVQEGIDAHLAGQGNKGTKGQG